MTPGAVLAAGYSSRMGRPKALLPAGASLGDTFLHRVLASMWEAGVPDLLVVGRPDDQELRDAILAETVRARFVPNPNHQSGQLTSIIAAVNAADHPGVRGILIMPVDIPLVRPETFAAVLRVSEAHPTSIVRATYAGRHGHPVVFDRGSFDALRRADPGTGAKAVLHAHADRVVNLDVDDDGVLKDIDSLEDYIEAFGGPPDAYGSGMRS